MSSSTFILLSTMSEATARLTLVMEPPGKHAARWNTTMQVGPIPTPEEIARYSELLTKIMNIDIPSYNTGRGRYQAPDTARVSEISKVSLPDLNFGKAPSPSVWSHLTLGNYKDLASNDKRRKAIEVWQKLEWPDAKAAKPKGEDALHQRTILEYCRDNQASYGTPEGAKLGRCVLRQHTVSLAGTLVLTHSTRLLPCTRLIE